MQERAPSSIRAHHARLGFSAGVPMTTEEKRNIFKSMVVHELEAGFLRYSRRQALLSYAGKLNISEFDACLLIAEAQYHAGDLEPLNFSSAVSLENMTRPEKWSVPMRISFALVLACFIDLMLINWIFG